MRTTLSFSALLLAAGSLADAAFQADPEYSLGLRSPFSEDRRSLPGWTIVGNTPLLLSDRMILTPPAPGNQRTGVWSQTRMNHDEWSVRLQFRASGAERPGGSLNIWYTEQGSGNGGGTETIYSSRPFDGLGIVIESRDGGMGQLRAYLNDGRMDFSRHHNPTSLAFGHCNFDYRNRGVLSSVEIVQTASTFRVETDGRLCFQTDEVKIPRGYYLGITGATTDPPDSFEIFSLITSRSDTPTDGRVKYGEHKLPPAEAQKQQQQQQQRRDDPRDAKYGEGQAPHDRDLPAWKLEQGEEDRDPSYYKTQQEQFADVHNRLQGLTHHLAGLQHQIGVVYDRVDLLHNKEESLRAEYRGTRVPREQIDRMESKIEALSKMVEQIAATVNSKDYSHQFDNLHRTLKEHHSNLLYAVPDSVTQVLESGKSHFTTGVIVLIILQIGAVGGFVVYKRRRNSSPKKYL